MFWRVSHASASPPADGRRARINLGYKTVRVVRSLVLPNQRLNHLTDWRFLRDDWKHLPVFETRWGAHGETHWITKKGQRRLIAWSNTIAVSDSGTVAYVIRTGTDVTDREAAQEEAGLAPDFAGLYQVNAIVPLGISPGNTVPVVISNGIIASNIVTIAVQ